MLFFRLRFVCYVPVQDTQGLKSRCTLAPRATEAVEGGAPDAIKLDQALRNPANIMLLATAAGSVVLASGSVALAPGSVVLVPCSSVNPRAGAIMLSQPPPPVRNVLGLVAISADLVSKLAKMQLGEGEETATDPLEEQKRESIRLRRSWDARLSWRLRKRREAEEALAAAERRTETYQTYQAWRDGGTPSFSSWDPHSTAAATEMDYAGFTLEDEPSDDELAEWDALGTVGAAASAAGGGGGGGGGGAGAMAPKLATAAAITAATVMQAAEMAAVAVIKSPEKPRDDGSPFVGLSAKDAPGAPKEPIKSAKERRLARLASANGAVAHTNVEGRPKPASSEAPTGAAKWAPALGAAATVTAATVMQVAEMTAVAAIKLAKASEEAKSPPANVATRRKGIQRPVDGAAAEA